jgi:hypothetical protein
MEFFNWMSLMFTIFCRLSGTDPEELSLASNKSTVGDKGSLFQQSTEGIQRRSRDNGLRTFLMYFCEIVNDTGVIEELTGHDDWVWQVSGLDTKDETAKEELTTKKLNNSISINDARVEDGKEPYKDIVLKFNGKDVNLYDIPAIQNQNVYQAVMTIYQGEQQQAMMERQQQIVQDQGYNNGDDSNNDKYPEPDNDEDMRIFQEYGKTDEDKEALGKAYQFLKNGKFFRKSMYDLKKMYQQQQNINKINQAIEVVVEE